MLGEIPEEGRAICMYLEGSDAPSPTGRLGLPSGGSNAGGYIDLMAEIGGALKAVDREEHRLTGKHPKINLLVKRWGNYLLMLQSRNALHNHKRGARKALKRVQEGRGMDDLQHHEEGIARETEAHQNYSDTNERFRRRTIYLKLMSTFREELKSRGVRV